MKEPTLIIMAAGMGSRYGGIKQVEPVSDQGEIILDFSLYDAMKAGFTKVIFVIREEMEKEFRQLINHGAGKHLKTDYAFQKLEELPEGYRVPPGRKKPWGTGHAVLCCKEKIEGPFAVINADDYYGATGFQMIYHFLSQEKEQYQYCMIGFRLKNTVSENGHVARGVCVLSEEGNLVEVVERTKIMCREGEIAFTEDDGATWQLLDPEATVSMNFWGFQESFIKETEEGFHLFLKETIEKNPVKGEYLLPTITDKLIKEGKAVVKVLQSKDKWCGVTYKEDKAAVVETLQSMKDKGLYPKRLWK